MKRLLVLSPWFPYPPDNGSRLRAFYLLRELAKTYRIRLVTGVQSDSPADVPAPLAALCETVVRVPWGWHEPQAGGVSALGVLLSPVPRSIRETPNPPLTAAIAAEVARPPDLILVMQMGMDAYLPPLPAKLPVVLDEVEISGLERTYRTAKSVSNRLRHGLTWAKGIRYWSARLRRYDTITTVSEEEASVVRRLIGKTPPTTVVPNGVDTAAYAPRDRNKVVPGRLIYNGALTYGPNRDAVRWFVAEMLPRIGAQVPDAHLWVTGRYNPDDTTGLHPEKRVHLSGFLPDMRSALAESEICVVPLLAGGGTRLKILEAWAAGVPVVSTSVGAAGLRGIDGTHLLLRDTPKEFADAVVALLSDPARAAALAHHARALVETQYDWTTIGAMLIDVLERVPTTRAETA